MLDRTQSTSSSVLSMPPLAQRPRSPSPSSEPPTQIAPVTEYATMDDLLSVVDTMKTKMDTEFGTTRELLRGIEQTWKDQDQATKDLLSRVETQLATQVEKLDQTVLMVKKSIGGQCARLEKRVLALEMQLQRAEEGFQRLENCVKDDVSVATVPDIPVVEAKRTFPPPTLGTAGPSSIRLLQSDPSSWAMRDSNTHPISRSASPQPEPGSSVSKPVSDAILSTIPSESSIVAPAALAREESIGGARLLRREGSLVIPKVPVTPKSMPHPWRTPASGGFAAWAAKEARLVPYTVPASDIGGKEVPPETMTAKEGSKEEVIPNSSEGGDKTNNSEGKEKVIEADEERGKHVATSSGKHPSNREAVVQDIKGKGKETGSDETLENLADTSSGNARETIRDTGELATVADSHGSGRSRKRGRDKNEESQPASFPPQEEPSRRSSKRRRNRR